MKTIFYLKIASQQYYCKNMLIFLIIAEDIGSYSLAFATREKSAYIGKRSLHTILSSDCKTTVCIDDE